MDELKTNFSLTLLRTSIGSVNFFKILILLFFLKTAENIFFSIANARLLVQADLHQDSRLSRNDNVIPLLTPNKIKSKTIIPLYWNFKGHQ